MASASASSSKRDSFSKPLLRVRDLHVEYRSQLRSGIAINNLSIDLAAGEALAIVGESGCGKSTTALALMGILPEESKIAGSAEFEGRDLLSLSRQDFRKLRGPQIGMVFQEPMTSLNPVYTVGWQIAEVLRFHQGLSKNAARARTIELLDLVAIRDPGTRVDSYPHELSGGQRQRAMIAMAIALKPLLLIADEPTTSLDATVQLQILELLDKLRRELSMSLLLISHDLPLVSRWTDRVVVMHHGEKMEEVASSHLFKEARHPYTQGLISAAIHLQDGRHYTRGALSEIRTQRTTDGQFIFNVTRDPGSGAVNASQHLSSSLLDVENLSVDYGAGRNRFRAVDNASFTIATGETLGLVGESGSGKSSLSRAVMRLQPAASGTIRFNGNDITRLTGEALRRQRRNVQMIFQDPYASLNPRHTVGEILGGVLALHDKTNKNIERDVATVLDQVGMPSHAVTRYPHEFSGGQRQRIGIARALILKPKLVVCDEPVSALDVSIQAQILNLLVALKQELNLAYLFISHDLAVVQYISDRVMVMKTSRIIETSDHNTIWQTPQNPYTKSLIAAVS